MVPCTGTCKKLQINLQLLSLVGQKIFEMQLFQEEKSIPINILKHVNLIPQRFVMFTNMKNILFNNFAAAVAFLVGRVLSSFTAFISSQ
jgi:hypothetical protein